MSNWLKLFDAESGYFYYCDEATGLTTWDTPSDCNSDIRVVPDSFNNLRWQVPGRRERWEFAQLRGQYLLQKAENIALDHEAARREAERKEKERQEQIWNKRIDEAKSTLHLNISWEQLKSLPDAVYEMQHNMPVGQYLLALRLIGQQMEELPTAVCTVLVGLRVLSLSHNEIGHLPSEIANLQELRDLNVTNNKLTMLPDNLGHLQQLKRLDISGNQIQRLPDSFAALTGLRHLKLEFNRLTFLPENLHLMSLVTRINACDNKLTRLPRCLSLMPKLHTLLANNNQIGYIPQGITQSPRLRNLKLCNNKIKLIPDAVGDWSNLRNLWLDCNFISTLPMNFYRLTHLESLKLEGNRSLLHPPHEVLDGGLAAVLRWCADRYHHQDAHRKRYLIRSMQEVLQQIASLDIADPAYFQADVSVNGDLWFAFDWNDFWAKMLPNLRKRCEALADMGVEVSSMAMAFSATEEEIRWAFRGYFDAYGVMMQENLCMFRRCACVDKQGNPKPCEPPSTGFACQKEATLIKKYIVLKRHRQEREWRQRKIDAIQEAAVVAEKHARNYLSSKEGSLYIKQLAFQKAEIMLHEQAMGKILSAQEKNQQARQRKLEEKQGKLVAALNLQLAEMQTRRADIEMQLEDLGGNEHLEQELEALSARIAELEKRIRTNTPRIAREDQAESKGNMNDDVAEDEKQDEQAASSAEPSRMVDRVWQMIELRFRKLMSTFTGRFSELQVQFELELKAMYVDYQIKLARRNTEHEWNVLQDVRENWLGQGVATVFRSWKLWVRDQVKQRKRDRREQWRIRINAWNTYQASLDIGRMRLDQWKQLIDPLSDNPYWANEETGESTWTQPVLSDFLPPNFEKQAAPEPLPDNFVLSSSSESSAHSSSDFESDDSSDSDSDSSLALSESTHSMRTGRRRMPRKRTPTSQTRSKHGRTNHNKLDGSMKDADAFLPTSRSSTLDSARIIRERQSQESDRALAAVLQRRERSAPVKHATYLAQRRVKPKAYREHLRALAELESGESQQPRGNTPKVLTRQVLAELVGFDGDHKQYSIDDYTRFASKAVALQNRHLQEQGMVKKQSRMRQYLEPLWKADEIAADDDADYSDS